MLSSFETLRFHPAGTYHKLVNFAAFQAAWLITVTYATTGTNWPGIIACGFTIILHLFISASHQRLTDESKLVTSALIVGLLWETTLFRIGLTHFPKHADDALIPPFWFILLWPLFATCLNVTLRYFHNRYVLSALFGAIGGPFSFYAGEKIGAISFSEPLFAYGILCLGWACLFPFMVMLAEICSTETPQHDQEHKQTDQDEQEHHHVWN